MAHDALSNPIQTMFHMGDVPAVGHLEIIFCAVMMADRDVVERFGDLEAYGVKAMKGVKHVRPALVSWGSTCRRVGHGLLEMIFLRRRNLRQVWQIGHRLLLCHDRKFAMK